MKIRKLTIYSDSVQDQLRHYRDNLNFSIRNDDEKSFEIVLGYSILKIEQRENATPYHIAFHIPDRQEHGALHWLERKTAILKNNDQKIIDFSNWDAKSVYFYDKDQNILEFISRREFSKPQSASFDTSSIIGIAEIGLATKDIKEKYDKMSSVAGLSHFDGDFERFCAVGNPSGLIITINKKEKDWFPTGDKAYSSDFEMEFEHSSKSFNLSFKDDELQISKT